MTPSLYIHIPFCLRRCIYCNFYSSLYDDAIAGEMIGSIIAQVKRCDLTVRSIYIGGGTPSSLSRKLLTDLTDTLKKFSIETGEYTFEANPESIDRDMMKLLLDNGVNRLSIGVQSFDDRKLKRLGRPHTAAKAEDVLKLARKTGFTNISADLIFGVWGEDLKSWKAELGRMARLGVDHVSCYELTYEKGTPLFDAVAGKSVLPLDEDTVSEMYETAIDTLALGGIKQYEVSNFARKGRESRHNMNYWDNGPYVGLGPSAVSYIDGARTRNVSDIKEYVDRSYRGKTLTEFKEKLSPLNSAGETAAVKIRTRDGIDFDWFKRRTGFDLKEICGKAITRLVEDGLIKYKRQGDAITGICLKRKGFLLCDTVSIALLC